MAGPVCSVRSAVSGEVIAVVEEYEGKTAKWIKQSLAARIGVTRFRQRLFLEDGCSEIEDDDVFAWERVNIKLVQLEFLPPDATEDQKMIAAAMDNDFKVLEKLLQEPRSPNVAGEAGWTPLHFAAESGHVEPMRLLLEAGAEIDARDEGDEGWTPLHCAASAGCLESVGLLLGAGADKDLAALGRGLAPLHMAAALGHAGVVLALIEAGADVTKALTSGQTPLYMAASGGHVEVVRALIQGGADVNRADPLCIAAVRGHVDIVQSLIEAGAHIEFETISLAVRYGHVGVVRLLQQEVIGTIEQSLTV